MPKFKVLVTVTQAEEYEVEAATEQEAMDDYSDGVYQGSEPVSSDPISAEEIK